MTARNYASFNPAALGQYLALERSGTVLTHDATCNNSRMALALYPKQSGIWFGEFVVFGDEELDSAGVSIGVATEAVSLDTCVGASADSYGYRSDGKLRDSDTDRAAVDAIAKDDVIGMLVDAGQRVVWYRNGLLQGELTLSGTHAWAIAVTVSNTSTSFGTKVLLNTGQQKFSYPPPLVTNQGWYDTTASFGALRVADRPALLDGKRYHGLVSARQSSLTVTQELRFWPWGDGQPAQGRASLALDNATGYADTLFAGDPRDSIVDMRDPETGEPLLSMLVDSAQSQGDAGVLIRLRDRMADTQVALQRRLIRPGADPSSAFNPWPIVYGAVYSIEPPLLDYAAQQYAVNDGPIAAMGVVRDKGDPFDYSAGDYTYSTTDGTITLHNGQAQGRVTIDMSSVGGQQLDPPVDLLNGDGDFTSGAHWTLGGGAASNSSISGGLLTLGDYTWPDSRVRSKGVISWAKYNNITLTAGRTYRIVIKVRRVSDAPSFGQPDLDVPARLEVTGGGASPSTLAIPWLSITAKRTPFGGWRNYDHSAETFVGYASPRGSNPALFIVLYGSYAIGDQAIIENIEVNEIGLDDFDDDSLVPIKLEDFMREVLEVRAGWSSDQWSAADAAAIDAATGYAGIGLYAASDSQLTVYDALQLAARAYCACLWIDDVGDLRITRLTAPEKVPPALIDHHIGIEDMLDEADIDLDMAENLSTQIGARKNWSPLSGSDLVTDGVELPGGGNPANPAQGIQGDIQFSDDGWSWTLDPAAVGRNLPVEATRWPTWSEVIDKPVYASAWGAINPASKADDADVVHRAGSETLSGLKTFTATMLASSITPRVASLYSLGSTKAPWFEVRADTLHGDLDWSYVQNAPSLVDEAPNNSTAYVRKGKAWVPESVGGEANPNLVTNPSGQLGIPPDTTVTAGATFSVVDKDGLLAFHLVSTTAGTKIVDFYFPIPAPSAPYSVSFDVIAGAISSRVVSAQLRYADASKSQIGANLGVGTAPADEEKHFAIDNYVAPAGAAYVVVLLFIQSSVLGDEFWVRRFKVETGEVATPYTPDALIDLSVSSPSVRQVELTATTPTSDPSRDGTLYLVY